MADKKRTMQVRGALSLEKIKAAQVLGGEEVRFELRAMKPVKAGSLVLSWPCHVCVLCGVLCITCSLATAKEQGIRIREELKG